jgi:exopolysaccharide production protein ExoY
MYRTAEQLPMSDQSRDVATLGIAANDSDLPETPADPPPAGLSTRQRALKRVVDLCGCAVVLLLWGWLFVLIAIAVAITTGRPVLFAQSRVGREGRTFLCYKFRTMVPDAEACLEQYLSAHPQARDEWDKYQKLANDPRVTPFGRFLRKYSLDELPQFWNVVTGEMSIVGPRQ